MSLGAGAGVVDVPVACSLCPSLANQKDCKNGFPLGPALGIPDLPHCCWFYLPDLLQKHQHVHYLQCQHDVSPWRHNMILVKSLIQL
eukprot:scaffold188813_cov12-Tisochrysis_lutea.AAC.1